MSRKFSIEIDAYIFANDEVDLSNKVRIVENAINALDFSSQADVKPFAQEQGKGFAKLFPKPIKIIKKLK